MQSAVFTYVEWAAPQCDQERLKRDLDRVMKALKAGRGPAEYLRSVHQRRSRLWWRSARMGVSSSRWIVGRCFADGIGVPQNVREAVRWYRWAAMRGCVLAQTDLGTCYARGEGVERDHRIAARWFAKAAAQGSGWAQVHLALCYLQGQGVRQVEFEAARLFREAAEQGYAAAQYHLGVCYLKGIGVEHDAAEARQWLRRAAIQGFAPAQFRLAVCPSVGGRRETPADCLAYLQRKLDAIDSAESAHSSTIGSVVRWGKSDERAKRKANLILSTPLPDGEANLLRFLSFAIAQGNCAIGWRNWHGERRVRAAWRDKTREAMQKLRIVATDNGPVAVVVSDYQSRIARWRKEEFRETIARGVALPFVAVASLVAFCIRAEI